MKFSKKFTILGSVLLGVSLLAGCSSAETPASTSAVTEVRISWWGGDSRNEAIQEAIKRFEEQNPDIKVYAEFSGYDGYQEKMTTQLSGGTAPDVVRLDSMWMRDYQNQLEDLNQYAELLGLENFSPESLEPLTEGGKLLGLPLSTNYRALYYNKTVLDEFGIEAPKSWEDVMAMREVLPDDYYPMANPQLPNSASPFFFFTLLIKQTGKPITDENGDLNYTEQDFVNVLTFYRELVDRRIMPSKKDVDNAGIVSGSPAPALMDGKWLTFFEWVANTNNIKNQLAEQGYEMALAGYPELEGQSSTGVWSKPSMAYAIPSTSKNKEAAARLINFLMNDEESNKIQKLENGVPDSSTGRATLEAEGLITPLVAESNALGAELLDPSLTNTFKWDRVTLSDTILNTITELDYGKITVEEAAKKFYDGFKAEEATFKQYR